MASRFWVGGTGTWDNSTTTHWAATTGGAGGQSVPGSADTVTFDGNSGGGTVTPNYNMTVTSITMGAFTGTLDFSVNNNNPTFTAFNCSGTGVRTFNMGGGTWTGTGNANTTWTCAVTTNLTFISGTSTLQFTYSGGTGTRTFNPGTANTYNNVYVTAGSDTFTQGNSLTTTGDFSTSGFTGTYNKTSQALNIGGNMTIGAGSTWSSTSGIITMSPSGSVLFTPNGVTINQSINISGTGTVTLSGNIDLSGTNTTVFTVTMGTFSDGGYTVKSSLFNISNSNIRTIVRSTTWEAVGTGTVWSSATTTNLTFTDTGTLKVSDASSSSKTISIGNLTSNNLWLTGGGTGAMIIGTTTGTCTFNNIKVDPSLTVQVFAGKTIIANSLTWSGLSAQLNTFQSTTNASPYFLNVNHTIVSLDYVSFQDAQQIGDSRFFAGVHSTNVSGNKQIIFTAPTQITGPFPTFFRQ